MRILKFWIIVVLLCGGLVGCTANQRVKGFGGTATKDLPAGRKLITVTWKETSLWYLTRPMREDEDPEEYSFQEDSSMGLINGTVIIKEHAKK